MRNIQDALIGNTLILLRKLGFACVFYKCSQEKPEIKIKQYNYGVLGHFFILRKDNFTNI